MRKGIFCFLLIFFFIFFGIQLGYANVWDIKTVDSDGNVGHDISLALDSNNNPCISYFDDTNGDLKYAYYNGSTWVKQTVDSDGYVHVGYYN